MAGRLGPLVAVSLSLAVAGSAADTPVDDPWRFVRAPGLTHPSDIQFFGDRYFATDVYGNSIAFSETLEFEHSRVLQAGADEAHWRSPHHFAISPWGTLLFTEGWGSAVVEVIDAGSGQWRRFDGRDDGLRAPHGICVDGQGWIYVGDSLNSRLVRFRDMEGDGFEVFADRDRRIAYVRQLVCTEEGVWISNSYERREGLNPGEGGNVLLLEDFSSGLVREIVRVPDANLTGVLPLPDGRVLFAMWGQRQRLGIGDRDGHWRFVDEPRAGLGVPYAIRRDPRSGDIVVVYLGTASADPDRRRPGGLLVIDSSYRF